MIVNGVLNLNKPVGPTSMDVVRSVKRLTQVGKIGHGGTLDPIASGVLPIFLGQATKLMRYLVDGTKIYRAKLKFGETTDTLDSTGIIVANRDPSGGPLQQIEEALDQFKGSILQVPPMYSALKVKGERLYTLARAGIDIAREPRAVEVSRIDLKSWEFPEATVEIECGRGFYVRSFAHDLGELLGCGAHLTALTRLRAGPLEICDASTMDAFQLATQNNVWQDWLLPMDILVGHLPAIVADPSMVLAVRQGRSVILKEWTESQTLTSEQSRLYTQNGRLLALGHYDKKMGMWKPDLVFNSEFDPPSQKEPHMSGAS